MHFQLSTTFLQPKCFSECSRTMSRQSSCRRKYFNYLNSSLSINCSKLWQTIEALWRCWLFSFDWQQQQQQRRRRVVSTFYQILGIIFKTVAKSFFDHPLVPGFLHKLTTWWLLGEISARLGISCCPSRIKSGSRSTFLKVESRSNSDLLIHQLKQKQLITKINLLSFITLSFAIVTVIIQCNTVTQSIA